MQPEINKNENVSSEEEFIKKLVNVSNEDLLLNSEIIQRELARMKEGYTPFFKNSEKDFNSWIRETITMKLILTTAAVLCPLIPYFQLINIPIFHSLLFYLFAFSTSLLVIYILRISILKIGARDLFDRFNISIKSGKKEHWIKLLSLTSMLLNNSLVDYDESDKLNVLKEVSNNFKHKKSSKIISEVNDLLHQINTNKYNAKKYGFKSKKEFEQFLDNNENLKSSQKKILSLFTGKDCSHIKDIDMKDGFVKGLLNSEIPENDASLFLKNFNKQFKKSANFSVEAYTALSVITNWLFFTTIPPALAMGFLKTLPSPLLLIILSVLMGLPSYVLYKQYKKIDCFINCLLDNLIKESNSRDVNIDINKLILFSIILKTKDAKRMFSERHRLNKLNEMCGSFISDNSFSLIDEISTINEDVEKREKKEAYRLKEKIKHNQNIVSTTNELFIYDGENMDEMALSAKKDILFPDK